MINYFYNIYYYSTQGDNNVINFKDWFNNIYNETMPFMDKSNKIMILKRYNTLSYFIENNKELSKMKKIKLKTIIHLMFFTIIDNKLNLCLIAQGIIYFSDLCGNEESIDYAKDNNSFNVLNLGKKGIFLSNNVDLLEELFIKYLIEKDNYLL